MSDPAEMTELVRRLIGRVLVAATEARHWYEGRRGGDAESLLHLWLHFQGVRPLKAHRSDERLFLDVLVTVGDT